ncbi:hypothetical protein [Caloranaerobacter ferrireducens]|uniref:hypothetical protein n=1 Tax=Caloranaerobacter ferrireducens TaxID=1323370 RepID=UPI00159EF86A|nr:hypothetical protein [Caloranaerobacter ferrireducens]
MKKICKYKNCRNEATTDSNYCKYHLRMVEIENKGPQWLNELIEKMAKERCVDRRY